MNKPEFLSYQDLLGQETIAVPAALKIDTRPEVAKQIIVTDVWTDPALFEREVDHLWTKVWQMACREEEIPEPGDHHVYWIIDRSVIVTRTPSGEIKGYINSCRHRGRCLRDESGSVDKFRCPFHGATWDLEGQFLSLIHI